MKTIKRSSSKGFVLIEFLILFVVLSLMLPMNVKDFKETYESIENKMLLSQLQAMANRKTVLIDADICPSRNCWYNPRGNINTSRTIVIERSGVQYELVIWLGFGRFKISKRISDD